MRWKTPKQPKEGDIKTITKFLWFPCNLQNETRWLETVSIKQEYVRMYATWEWQDIGWASP